MVLQEVPTGIFADTWAGKLSSLGLETIDISPNIGYIMSPKDKNEILNTKKAAFLLTGAMNNKAVKDIEGRQPS